MTPKDIAIEIAAELGSQGALAVALMGSHARGDAMPHSDIDVIALGDGPAYRLERRDGHLIALSWMTSAAVEQAMMEPAKAGFVVQGWRDAEILKDPAGAAACLQDSARAWDWSRVETERWDAYVAEELTGLAEEVHKLVNLRASANDRGAAVQRSILAFRIGAILAVHLRLLYASENELWNLVADQLDDCWASAQDAALGIADVTFAESCVAALAMYRLAGGLVEPLLDERQQAVVFGACALELS